MLVERTRLTFNYLRFPWCSQAFPAFTRFLFSNEIMVQRVILRPKRKRKVDTSEWKIVFSTDLCDQDASSWSELISGKMVTRPKNDEVFVNDIPPDVTRMIRCLGVAISDDKWLDDITIWTKDAKDAKDAKDGVF